MDIEKEPVKEVSLESIKSHSSAGDLFPCAKFINRTNESARFKQVFYTVVTKSNLLQTVFVSGEAGIGKTRFLNEMENYVRNDAIIISARSSLEHSNVPYYLFIKGISAYIRKLDKDTHELRGLLSDLPQEELAGLSRVIPLIDEFIHLPEDIRVVRKVAV